MDVIVSKNLFIVDILRVYVDKPISHKLMIFIIINSGCNSIVAKLLLNHSYIVFRLKAIGRACIKKGHFDIKMAFLCKTDFVSHQFFTKFAIPNSRLSLLSVTCTR